MAIDGSPTIVKALHLNCDKYIDSNGRVDFRQLSVFLDWDRISPVIPIHIQEIVLASWLGFSVPMPRQRGRI